jgi:hypothetical protein
MRIVSQPHDRDEIAVWVRKAKYTMRLYLTYDEDLQAKNPLTYTLTSMYGKTGFELMLSIRRYLVGFIVLQALQPPWVT